MRKTDKNHTRSEVLGLDYNLSCACETKVTAIETNKKMNLGYKFKLVKSESQIN